MCYCLNGYFYSLTAFTRNMKLHKTTLEILHYPEARLWICSQTTTNQFPLHMNQGFEGV